MTATGRSLHDRNALPAEEAELRKWITAWYEHAISAGFIRPPYVLDDVTARRLEAYFRIGLTPREGAGVMFGTLH
jgi:hypothetical protein